MAFQKKVGPRCMSLRNESDITHSKQGTAGGKIFGFYTPLGPLSESGIRYTKGLFLQEIIEGIHNPTRGIGFHPQN